MSIHEEFRIQLLNDCDTYRVFFGIYPVGRDMINKYGAVEAAKKLVRCAEIQPGFKRLMQYGPKGRQITMESRILEPRFSVLFEQETLDYARFRIDNWKNM